MKCSWKLDLLNDKLGWTCKRSCIKYTFNSMNNWTNIITIPIIYSLNAYLDSQTYNFKLMSYLYYVLDKHQNINFVYMTCETPFILSENIY